MPNPIQTTFIFASLMAALASFSSPSTFSWCSVARADETATSELKEVPLAEATSDVVTGTMKVNLLVNDDDTLAGVKNYGSDGTKAFELSDLPKGVVLYKRDGRDVIVATAKDFSVSSGGTLTLSYLTNALLNQWQKIQLEVRHEPTWALYVNERTGRRKVFSMYLKGRIVFGQVIGIESIKMK